MREPLLLAASSVSIITLPTRWNARLGNALLRRFSLAGSEMNSRSLIASVSLRSVSSRMSSSSAAAKAGLTWMTTGRVRVPSAQRNPSRRWSWTRPQAIVEFI